MQCFVLSKVEIFLNLIGRTLKGGRQTESELKYIKHSAKLKIQVVRATGDSAAAGSSDITLSVGKH